MRGELALKLKPLIAARAKKNVRAGGGSGASGRQKSDNPVDTKKELAKIAGVSHDTIAKGKVIIEKASEEVKERLRKGEVSVNEAHKKIKAEEKREKKQAVAERDCGIGGRTFADAPETARRRSRAYRENSASTATGQAGLVSIDAHEPPWYNRSSMEHVR